MKVHLEPVFMRDTVQVWVYDGVTESSPGRVLRLGQLDNGPLGPGMRWEEHELGARPEPTLELRTDILEAIVKAAADTLPVTPATERHLADATASRDRITSMLEHLLGMGDTNGS